MTKTPAEHATKQLSEHERLTAEIDRLEIKQRQLDLSLGEFLHETRRVRDALERVGGHSHALDARARALRKNVKLTRKDLEKTAMEIEKLRQRCAEIAAQIEPSDGG